MSYVRVKLYVSVLYAWLKTALILVNGIKNGLSDDEQQTRLTARHVV